MSTQICTKNLVFVISCFIFFSAQVLWGQSPANERFSEYVPKLKNKKVGLVVNHTSVIGSSHLADTLLSMGVQVTRLFAPEHGFRGDHSAGATVSSSVDAKTGLPIVSLYGKNKKPAPSDLAGLDWVVFDIQDVGVRFYTYISTMHWVMEACAESSIPFMILDRPNPNGHYVDGPILEPGFESFIGMHPIPIVHGLTVGELALMINGEGWLKGGIQCKLEIVLADNYAHSDYYALTKAPSPNLPNMRSVLMYPGMCLFEGTKVSLGRGTDWPFQVFGFPGWHSAPFEFTPKVIPGVADNPPHKYTQCQGFNLNMVDPNKLFLKRRMELDWLLIAYKNYPNPNQFFTPFFDKLAGNSTLRKQIESGFSATQIRNSWTQGLQAYQEMRKKYLLYPLWRE